MQHTREQARPTAQVKASYRELRRAREEKERRWQVDRGRHGLMAWWLDLVAPPPPPTASLDQQERQRKAELSAYVLLGLLVMGLALIPNGLVNLPTLMFSVVMVVTAVVAGALNRSNRTTVAAIVLIVAFSLALGGALATAPQLDLMWMPALDFFSLPVLLSGLLLSRRTPFVVASLGAVVVALLLELKPRDSGLGHMVATLGIYHFMVRPFTMLLIVAVASWLWARSVEQAIVRADRAEELAVMEHSIAEQKHRLEDGIQDLLETHVRVANGDFSARAATSQQNVLWQIAVSLNNLLARLGKFAYVDQQLHRTEAEVDRLATTVENARTGRGVFWPAPSGTRVDRLLRVLASDRRDTLSTPAADAGMDASAVQSAPSQETTQATGGAALPTRTAHAPDGPRRAPYLPWSPLPTHADRQSDSFAASYPMTHSLTPEMPSMPTSRTSRPPLPHVASTAKRQWPRGALPPLPPSPWPIGRRNSQGAPPALDHQTAPFPFTPPRPAPSAPASLFDDVSRQDHVAATDTGALFSASEPGRAQAGETLPTEHPAPDATAADRAAPAADDGVARMEWPDWLRLRMQDPEETN